MAGINYIYVFILSCGLLSSAIVPLRILRKSGISSVAMNPLVLFSVYFGVVHFLTPLVKHLDGYYRYQNTYYDSTLLSVASLTFLLYHFAVGLKVFSRPLSGAIGFKNDEYLRLNKLVKLSLAIFAVGALAAWMDFKVVEDVVGVQSFISDRHLAAEERGSGRVLANLMIVGFALYIATNSVRSGFGGNKLLILACMLVGAFAYYSVISSRNSMLLMMLFGVAVYASSGKGAVKKTGLGTKNLFFLTAAALVTIGIVYLFTVQRYGASDSDYAQNRLDKIGLYMLDGAFGNDEALLWMVEHDYNLLMGKTYLAAFLNVIPRGIWEGKPLGGGPELINMISPGSYVIGQQGNNSLTTGLLAEAMMNFGILGLFLTVFVWAAISRHLLKRIVTSNTLPLRILYVMVAVSFNTALLYSEFLGFVVRLGIYLLPIILIHYFRPLWGRRLNHAV